MTWASADMQHRSAAGAARADRKAEARHALIDLLQQVGQLARVLRADGHAVPPCDLPASKSDQSLLTAGRQLALDLDAHPELTQHGFTSAHATEVTAAFDAATATRGTSRAAASGAIARLTEVAATGVRNARRLDAVVANALAADSVALALWKQARRLRQPRTARGAGGAEPPAPGTKEGPINTEAA
jgi:hypothetical protein